MGGGINVQVFVWACFIVSLFDVAPGAASGLAVLRAVLWALTALNNQALRGSSMCACGAHAAPQRPQEKKTHLPSIRQACRPDTGSVRSCA